MNICHISSRRCMLSRAPVLTAIPLLTPATNPNELPLFPRASSRYRSCLDVARRHGDVRTHQRTSTCPLQNRIACIEWSGATTEQIAEVRQRYLNTRNLETAVYESYPYWLVDVTTLDWGTRSPARNPLSQLSTAVSRHSNMSFPAFSLRSYSESCLGCSPPSGRTVFSTGPFVPARTRYSAFRNLWSPSTLRS